MFSIPLVSYKGGCFVRVSLELWSVSKVWYHPRHGAFLNLRMLCFFPCTVKRCTRKQDNLCPVASKWRRAKHQTLQNLCETVVRRQEREVYRTQTPVLGDSGIFVFAQSSRWWCIAFAVPLLSIHPAQFCRLCSFRNHMPCT